MYRAKGKWVLLLAVGVLSCHATGADAKKDPKLRSLWTKYRAQPLEGQNFWHLGAEDVYPGTITFTFPRKEIRACSKDSLVFTPFSTYGRYTYRLTRLAARPNDRKPQQVSPQRPHVASEQIRIEDAGRIAENQRLLLHGTIRKVEDGGRRLLGTFTFAGEDIDCRVDLIATKPGGPQPPPTMRSIPYGPHWRHAIDFYRAEGKAPAPLVVQIHGGGWGALDKSGTMGIHKPMLAAGISFASINYRYCPAPGGGVKPPVKWPLRDAARAIQTLRWLADELRIDGKRIAAVGGSAGGCSSLWLALHDDMAEANSPDPVARQSTRLWCAGGVDPQTSLDPRQMREWIPTITYGAHAFGIPRDKDRLKRFEAFLARREELLPWIREYSPYALASRDDPPIYLAFPMRGLKPAPGEKGHPTHSPMFGVKLKERLDELGVECYVQYKHKPSSRYRSLNDFLVKKLKGQAGSQR